MRCTGDAQAMHMQHAQACGPVPSSASTDGTSRERVRVATAEAAAVRRSVTSCASLTWEKEGLASSTLVTRSRNSRHPAPPLTPTREASQARAASQVCLAPHRVCSLCTSLPSPSASLTESSRPSAVEKSSTAPWCAERGPPALAGKTVCVLQHACSPRCGAPQYQRRLPGLTNHTAASHRV